jgi:hypothetical protein
MFEGFQKIGRLSKGCIITEKIDGTNAQVCIGEDGGFLVGSRNREITPGNDNMGFATWAYSKKQELIDTLGPGRHFGEWWGGKIQRGYGVTEKRFSLFNTTRWDSTELPDGVFTVPVLYEGDFNDYSVSSALEKLKEQGSLASPGFMNPEGIVIFHKGTKALFKVTYEHNEGKWKKEP